MAKTKGGLDRWFSQKWVDVSRKNPDGSHPSCGRASSDDGAYPKCVPAAKARTMSATEKASAVRRKRAAEAKKPAGQKAPAFVPTKSKR